MTETVKKQSWDSPAEFLKVLTRLLLPVTKVYPQMPKSHTSIKNIANSLKSIYVKKIIGRKRNERWELPCSLQSGSSWLLHWWHAQRHWCAGTTSLSCQQTQSSCTLLYNCLEAHSWSPSFIFRNILPSKCRKIVSADKTERWSLHTSVAEHTTNGVVKMTQIEDCMAILTCYFFSFLWSSWRKCSSSCWQYSELRCVTLASVGTPS